LCLATDRIDPDAMKRKPRLLSEKIADGGFFRTMCVTGLLTGATTLAVYLHVLGTSTPQMARSAAFATLVFAELLRSFGARSETKPIWRIPLFSNTNLLLVIALSCGIQLWSQHSAVLERVLKTSAMPFSDIVPLLAMGAIPLAALELVKVLRNRFAAKTPAPGDERTWA
jgi:Ca2+-transporting ATPase